MPMIKSKNTIRKNLACPKRDNGPCFFLRILALLLSACCFLTACAKEPEPREVPAISAEPEQAILAEAPVDGGRLMVPIPTIVDSLDPFVPQTKQMRDLLNLVYEPIARYDSTRRLSAVLAESWEKVDEEGRVWRIRLRSTAKWQGEKSFMTVDDVIYTYELLKSDFYEDSLYRPLVDRIEAMRSEGEQTLIIEGKESGYINMHAMTFPIVSREFFRLGEKPVGTGPYVMTDASQRQGILLASNEEWWHRAPYIKQIDGVPMGEDEMSLGALEIGNLNFVPSSVLTSSRYREQGEIGMIEVLSQQSEVILVNHRNSLLSELPIRKAIAYALDQRSILSKAYLNHGIATDVSVPPDSWLYNSSSKKYDVNLDMAKQLLAESGWEDLDNDGVLDRRSGDKVVSLSFQLLVNDTPENQLRKEAAQSVKEQLEAIGFSINIVTAGWNAGSADYGKQLQEGLFDLAMVGFNLDGSNDLRPYIASDGIRNYGAYSNQKLDEMLREIAHCTDEKELKTLFDEVQIEIVNELPFIQLYFRTTSIGFTENLLFPDGSMAGRDDFSFNGIEKWYFDFLGRQRYQTVSASFETNWARFDEGRSFGIQESEEEETQGLAEDENEDVGEEIPQASSAISASSSATEKPKTPDARVAKNKTEEETQAQESDEDVEPLEPEGDSE